MKISPIYLIGGAGLAYLAYKNFNGLARANKLEWSNPRLKFGKAALTQIPIDVTIDITNPTNGGIALDYFYGSMAYQGKAFSSFTFDAQGKNYVIEPLRTNTITFTVMVKNLAALQVLTNVIKQFLGGKKTDSVISVTGNMFAANINIPVAFSYDVVNAKLLPPPAKITGILYTNKEESIIGRITASATDLQSLIPAVKLRITRGKLAPTDMVRSSSDLVNIFKKYIGKNQIETQELFAVAYLDQSNKVLGVYITSMGGINSTVADVRLILAGALNMGAVNMVICHNHPSGNTKPSEADNRVTSNINAACKIHDIKLLDHIIITKQGYYSFAENRGIGSVNSNLRFVEVTYSDGTKIGTSMAAHLTDRDIKSYFSIGKKFNIGKDGRDYIVTVAAVNIMQDPDEMGIGAINTAGCIFFGDGYDINNLDDLRKTFYKLSKIYHPDAGGTTADFQKLQAEYETLKYRTYTNNNFTKEQVDVEVEIDAVLNAIYEQIMNIPGLVIEVVGTWLWVSGNTFPVKDQIKAAGLTFAGAKKMWYFAGTPSSNKGKPIAMDDIRNKYGSKIIKGKNNNDRRISGNIDLVYLLERLKFLLSRKKK